MFKTVKLKPKTVADEVATAATVIAAALDDPDWEVRKATVDVLGALGVARSYH